MISLNEIQELSDHETCGNSINRCIPVAVRISGSHITMTMAAIVQAIYHRTKLVALLAPHFCARKTLFSSAISTWICNLQCRGGLSKALQFSASQEFDLPLEYPYGNLSSPNTCATENVLCSGEKKTTKNKTLLLRQWKIIFRLVLQFNLFTCSYWLTIGCMLFSCCICV